MVACGNANAETGATVTDEVVGFDGDFQITRSMISDWIWRRIALYVSRNDPMALAIVGNKALLVSWPLPIRPGAVQALIELQTDGRVH